MINSTKSRNERAAYSAWHPSYLRLAMLSASALVLLTMMPLSAAASEANRYAFVVGSNIGGPDETPLEYAETDAMRIARVMEAVGGIDVDDVVLLLGATVDEFESEFAALQERIVAEQADSSRDALLFVYFSGHADAHSLHLHGTNLSFDRLRELMEASPAEARVLTIDACRSGELTRVKGAQPVEPFQMQTERWSVPRGMAIMTSAAAGEDAQESERLRGGFFTHHLITGLMGAASEDDRAQVTLNELYRYAYEETVRSTSRAPFVQHPTYAFDMRGRDDIVLTHPGDLDESMGFLELVDPGEYVIFEGDADGPVAADLKVAATNRIALSEGTYYLRHRRSDAIYETDVEVLRGEVAKPSSTAMRRVPYPAVVRRGISDSRSLSLGTSAAFGMAGEILDGTGSLAIGHLRGRADFSSFTAQLGLRYGRSKGGNDVLDITQQIVGIDAAVSLTAMWWRLSTGIGLRVGADSFQQTFDSDHEIASRRSAIWRVGPVLHLESHLRSSLSIFVDGGIDFVGVNQLDPETQQSKRAIRTSPSIAAGLTLHVR